MSEQTHRIVRDLVSDELDDTTASALQWYFRNILFFEQEFDRDERVLLVSYERLVREPREGFERIFQFSGIDYSSYLSRKVSPRSIGKNPEPAVAPAVLEICDDLLKRFSDLIE